jgi:hypothetical protein
VKVSTVDCVEAAATAVFKTEYFTPEYLIREPLTIQRGSNTNRRTNGSPMHAKQISASS